MNPDEELVYEVDENDQILRIVRRGELTDNNLRHRSVAILFRDAAGRILVHRRAAAKRVFPQYYDMFVAGMVPAGESYDQAARREAGEEVGQHNVVLRPVGKWRYDDDKVPQWASVYTATVTGPVVPQPEEVEWFGFLTEAELAESIAQERLLPGQPVPLPAAARREPSDRDRIATATAAGYGPCHRRRDRVTVRDVP